MLPKLLQLVLFAIMPYFAIASASAETSVLAETAIMEELVTALDMELGQLVADETSDYDEE